MKKILFVALLFITNSIYSQTLDSFMGIKFGTSRDSVKKIMLSKQGCTLNKESSGDDFMAFQNVKFAGREALFISFKFVDNKFHTSSVLFTSTLESKAIELYNDIKDELNEKYYKTESDFETYKYPYEKDDGHVETAIKIGKATFSSFWGFKNSNDENITNYISLIISETLSIILSYQDSILLKIAIEREKQKNNADY